MTVGDIVGDYCSLASSIGGVRKPLTLRRGKTLFESQEVEVRYENMYVVLYLIYDIC